MSIELSDYRYNSSLQAILGEATELRQLKLNYNLQKMYTCGSEKVICFIFKKNYFNLGMIPVFIFTYFHEWIQQATQNLIRKER